MVITDVLAERRAFAIVRAPSADTAVRQAATLADLGFPLVEITLNTPGALDAIATLRPANSLVGAGTVRTAADAGSAVEAGAAFLVTPALVTEVLDEARRLGVPVLCGAATATEVMSAWHAGAAAVKLFPAVSPDHLRALRAPLDDIPLVPVGGVAIGQVRAYLAAGALAVGLGRPLIGDGTDIEARVAALREQLA
ncbi:bifunctional 4-hydroxy-2-oxoglutarate aldolase/2-dehydro-3-deoxy-phosphogluconate aldolase [Amycolatopsis sp. PS_44_ISF1]|uniref:bifunctional 4-hydroxy-2-oxoglutarate aldolase/2-dehydro-3-deoxy-phosphogluconate aldolase n=1 Tax=Amycolatopsis sp. PS_44_ISF1 TaxID=2974917 RepID=UPI0028DDCC2A|nr:bifunctional 4-hydroxy-2-oxoglutarate aldolase/2-dehydro-3-deoxy-phosphogluconate aldolase [Amycolatopsis sp. PS_44_ISF1]MDT8913639.1 bifunctional 4-hydroxy-2-oxoglutarate aldolase/2-dehydro-3-deoxy-phosphogluconate aldolase [Amycolatopsis sp. PS_44_ISF1]